MKDRILFFVLGFLLATFAYLAGGYAPLVARDFDNVKEDDVLEITHDVLEVSTINAIRINVKDIVVGGLQAKGRVRINVSSDGVPSIHLFNGEPGGGGKASEILLTCFSDRESRQPHPKENKPRLELSSENGLDTYTLTSLGAQYKREDR